MTEKETPRDYPFDSDLPNDIMTWLNSNKNLPKNDRLKTVKLMLLRRANFASLLDWAAQGFMLDEIVSDYNNDFPYIALNTIIQTETRIEGLETDRKKKSALKANAARKDNFKNIKDRLQVHWKKNINPNKKATEAAILLEKTIIYEESDPKPKRSTLEGYVREWQKTATIAELKT